MVLYYAILIVVVILYTGQDRAFNNNRDNYAYYSLIVLYSYSKFNMTVC